MTNEQLAAFLHVYIGYLEQAIKDCESLLPKNAFRKSENLVGCDKKFADCMIPIYKILANLVDSRNKLLVNE